MTLSRLAAFVLRTPSVRLPGHSRWSTVLAVLAVLLGVFVVEEARAQEVPSFREVVLTGDEVPLLLGAAPGRIGAFAYDGADWTPIPVQVDERERLDLAVAYDGRDAAACAERDFCFERDGTGVTVLEYTGTDATGVETLIGPDSDPTFDDDDEVVFMERFAGGLAPADAAPQGADLGTRTAIRVAPGASGRYVYLFVVPRGTVPRSPERLVRFDFVLDAGRFPEDYDFRGLATSGVESGEALGANPERTTVETAYYRLLFHDRWIHDDLRLKRGGDLGPDLLDRSKVLLELGSCNRTEWTASSNRGTLVTLRDGPVRAIRAVRGFNSGPLTTGTYVFYERHATFTTDLRVHPIPGVVEFFDYSEAALGMEYVDALRPDAPLALGAGNDVLESTPLGLDTLYWSALSGGPGALVHAYRLQTDWAEAPFARYWDEGNTVRQCTGDDRAIGASGVIVPSRIPATDPRRDEFVSLRATRAIYYSADPVSAATAAQIAGVLVPEVERRVSEGSLGASPRVAGAVIEALFPSLVRTGRAEAQLALYEAAPYDVAVFDLLGRRVFEQRLVPSAPTRMTLALALDGVPAGPYWLRVRSETSGFAVSQRLTVVR